MLVLLEMTLLTGVKEITTWAVSCKICILHVLIWTTNTCHVLSYLDIGSFGSLLKHLTMVHASVYTKKQTCQMGILAFVLKANKSTLKKTIMSMTRKCQNYILQTNLWHHKEETQNINNKP